MRTGARSNASTAGAALVIASLLAGRAAAAQDVLPIPPAPFEGVIGRTLAESKKDFPKAVQPPAGAPNVLLILTDDVGFGASSTFGGPIPTPTMQRLADAGLRYTAFHTTALCSPTRAALLTGRNHHSDATGIIMELGTGFPGYNTLMPKSNGSVAEILKLWGYNTAWYGKNHNVPDWQSSQAGPFDLWPTGLGFEYFYGFIGGDANQWDPALFEGIKPIEPPHDDPNYFFDTDMANHAIARLRLLNAVAPQKPFFFYYAPGTAHAPHHAPPDWIARFKGKFDQGWDVAREQTFARQKQLGLIPANAQLTPRPADIPAWNTLNPKQKQLYAHMMEVYAAALAHCDYQMGRIIDAIDAMGRLENTLIIYIQGDNGASAEGGFNGLLNEMTVFNAIPENFDTVFARMNQLGSDKTYNHYPIGWAHAMDAPYQWTKQIASHFGGTRNGMVISWPAHIKDRGGIRPQFHHVIDVMPTILEAVGVPSPDILNGVAQKPVEGVSMAYSFDSAQAPSHHHVQYFEMFANRAIYQDGWVAATTPPIAPWVSVAQPISIDDYKWELYNTNDDWTEANNLAAKEPERLRQLQDLFWAEAGKYNVLPIDNSRVERFDVSNRPSLTAGRNKFTYYPGMTRIPEGAAPDLKNRSFTITADVVIPKAGAEGLLVTHGGRFAGFGLYLLQGRPVYFYNLAGVTRYTVAAKNPLSPGAHTIVLDFRYDGGGVGKGGVATITVDGKEVAQGRIEQTLAFRVSLDETFDVGEDTGTPISETYAAKMPFAFTGTLNRLTVDISGVGAQTQREEDEGGVRSVLDD